MKTRLNFNKIARGLGAQRRGSVNSSGGYFGAMELLSDLEVCFRVPVNGGRATDPGWTERRLVPFAPKTLKRLEALTRRIREQGGTKLEPMQIAGLLLEKTLERITESEAEDLVDRNLPSRQR
jgi:hypothetical protein